MQQIIKDALSEAGIASDKVICSFNWYEDQYICIFLPQSFTEIWKTERLPYISVDKVFFIDIRSFALNDFAKNHYSRALENNKVEYEGNFAQYANLWEDNVIEQLLLNTLILPKNTANINEFIQSLTQSEKTILCAIFEDIGMEGNISIVKCIQKIGFSRPVYTSLLARLEKYQIAQVIAQGVKGTHIKFLCNIKEIVE